MNATPAPGNQSTTPTDSEPTRPLVEIGKLLAETSRIQAETVKLQADTHEVNARTAKLVKESRWYPVVVGTALVAAGAT